MSPTSTRYRRWTSSRRPPGISPTRPSCTTSDIYNRWLSRVGPDHILLAQDTSGDVVGLGLAISAPQDTINIRTIAVKPNHSGFGLGQAIAAELYRQAIDAGQQRVHHCQMGPNTPPQRWDGGLGVVTREYQMFERTHE